MSKKVKPAAGKIRADERRSTDEFLEGCFMPLILSFGSTVNLRETVGLAAQQQWGTDCPAAVQMPLCWLRFPFSETATAGV